MRKTLLAVVITTAGLLACCGAAESWIIAQNNAQTFTLNAEASATWQRINQADAAERERHDREMGRLTDLRVAMLQGAGIPQEAWGSCTANKDGIVVCAKPQPSPAPKK
jgi:hypothetical protein